MKTFNYKTVLISWVVTVAVLVIFAKSCQDTKRHQQDLLDNIRTSRDSTKHFRDKSGQLVSQVEVMSVTVNDLKKNSDLLSVDNKNLKAQVGKLSNLVTYYKGKQVVRGQAEVVATDSSKIIKQPLDNTKLSFVKPDSSISGKRIYWTNGFLTVDEFYNPVNDSVDINYVYLNTIDFKTYYGKRPGLFKAKPLLADVKMSDPNALIYDSWAIVVNKPKKKWYQKPFFWGVVTGVVGGAILSR